MAAADCHGVLLRSGLVQVRYRYRLYPDTVQRQALARAFGCARVVFNDAVRLRDQAYQRGERLSDTEVQRRVVTLAKLTPEREWLREVASVVLVQACRDARRAYRNWFDSWPGRGWAEGPGTRSSSASTGGSRSGSPERALPSTGAKLYVAKVGRRDGEGGHGSLPSVPSSVTAMREPDGRYYASFVVERDAELLPPCERETGIERGTEPTLAVLSDGTKIAAPRFLLKAERRLKKAQRALSRRA